MNGRKKASAKSSDSPLIESLLDEVVGAIEGELTSNAESRDCFLGDPELFVSLLFARTAIEKIQLKLDQLGEMLKDHDLSENNRAMCVSTADDLTQCVMHCMTAQSELCEALGLDSLNP